MIDPWFISKLQNLANLEIKMAKGLNDTLYKEAKNADIPIR